MKLSSRKKLLKEADLILKEINSNISNNKRITELDWERHIRITSPEQMAKERENTERFIKFLTTKKVGEIEKKYRPRDISYETHKEKQKEIDELLEYLRRFRDHLNNYERIPIDPEKQTELQKAIVNTPYVKELFATVFLSPLIKDPETGFWWNADLGIPWPHGPVTRGLNALSPPRKQGDVEYREYMEFLVDAAFGGYQWDETRSWFYNVLNRLAKSFRFGG